MKNILRKTLIILMTVMLTLVLSSCFVITGADDASHSGGYNYVPSIQSYTPSLNTTVPGLYTNPPVTNAPSVNADDENFEDVFEYIGMVDSNCIEVKTCCSENFIVLRLNNGVKGVFNTLGINKGDLITVEYIKEGYNSFLVSAVSTDIDGPNPGFYKDVYKYIGRVDYNSIEVENPSGEGFGIFSLTDELKSYFDGYNFEYGDEISVSYIHKMDGNNVIYMVSGSTANPS